MEGTLIDMDMESPISTSKSGGGASGGGGGSTNTPGVHKINLSPQSSMKDLGSDSEFASQLEGEMTVPGQRASQNESTSADFNTLDEPILLTITRDLKAVGQKFVAAMLANESKSLLTKEWDLWGPLFLSTYIGLILESLGGNNAIISQFTAVIIVVCFGTAAVTYMHIYVNNVQTSIFQVICVLGYALGPLAIAVTIFELMSLLGVLSGTFFVRLMISAAAAGWSSVAAYKVLGPGSSEKTAVFQLGPIALYYGFLAVLILYYSGL